MKKDLGYCELLDIYGKLLTPHQREVASGYYDYDLSLSELAENMNVSRQAVHDALEKAEETLDRYEECVGYRRMNKAVRETLMKVEKSISAGENSAAIEAIHALIGGPEGQ